MPRSSSHFARRLLSRSALGARATRAAVALGFYNPETLHQKDRELFAKAPYTGEAHNLSGLFSWEQEALERYFRGKENLLHIAAGGGRELLGLTKQGFRVDAFECNPELVAWANRFLGSQRPDLLQIQPMARDLMPRGPNAPYDGAVLGWTCYSLIVGRRHRIAMLRDLYLQLRANAPILLSFFLRGEESRYHRLVHKVGGRIRQLRRAPPLELGDDFSATYTHAFTRAELCHELMEASFEVLELTAGRQEAWAVAIPQLRRR